MKKKLFIAFMIIFALVGSVCAQQRTITGTVKSAADASLLPGVTVLVKGTSIGAITNADGQYSITVPKDAQTLTFSFVGMEKKDVSIGNSNIIDVEMVTSTTSLKEVVVTALGIKKEQKALGFSAQKLGPKSLSDARELSIGSYLKGKVAGLQASSTSSGMGGSSVVTIRGNSSLTGNNQPLYVVDGVPITNLGHSSGGGWGDQDYGDGIGDINPEDIASISVLKGPNASALYGSRGANGVILITTKSGKARKGIGVELNSNVYIDKINLVPTFQNKYATGYEGTNLYGHLVEIPPGSGKYYETMDTWHGDSWGPPLDGRRTIVDPFVYPGTEPRTLVLLPQPENNVRDFYQTGIINNTTLALSGGNETTTARLSLGNTDTKGIIPNSRIQRQTINLITNTNLSDKLSFNAKVNYIHNQGNNRPILGSSADNITRDLVTMGRYVPLPWLKEYYEKTGDWGHWPGIGYNPYYIINELKSEDKKDRIIGFASLKYNFTSWLSLLARGGTDFYTQSMKRIWPVGARGGSNRNGRLTNNSNFVQENNLDALLTASGKISGNFSGSLSVGTSLLTQKRTYQGWDARDLKAAGVYDVSNAQDVRPSFSLWQKEMQSVYFTGQIGYKDYLFLDVTGRNDWSSALGKGNYSFFYPSVSTSFVFTDALKIQSDMLTFGKVRASWAQVGNDSDPYLTKTGFHSYTTTYNGQSLSSMSGTIPLYNLKNELTESWEIGTDLRFFQNRISLDLTYYNGKTTNQILPITISNSSGYSSVVINAGEIDNKGMEAVLNINPIRTGSGFRWDLTFNYARNHSKVIKLAPGIETYVLYGGGYPNIIEARPGQPYGNIVGYAFKRAPDGQKIVGEHGNYLREDKKSILGNITPDWIGGLNNTLSFKGLSMNFLIDFVQGGELSSSTKYQMEAKGTGKFTEEGRRPRDMDDQGHQLPYVGVLDGVVEVKDAEGNVTGYKKNTLAVNGQTYWADRAWGGPDEEFVLDASYIMLREVILSYNFKLKTSSITGIRLSLVGRNLWYIEEHMQGMGISPESAPNTSAGAQGIESISMPTTRTYGLNVKLTF